MLTLLYLGMVAKQNMSTEIRIAIVMAIAKYIAACKTVGGDLGNK